MAGFQVLLAPEETRGLPAEAPGAAAEVKTEDFSGRGVAGGVAGGTPPQTVSAAVAESLANAGAAADVHLRERPGYRLADADRIIEPRLLNRDEVAREVLARYPEMLRQASIEGSAVVQFWVDTTGRAVPGSARVLSSTHEMFAQAALAVVPRTRFSPGEAVFDGIRVRARILVRMPLSWTML
jgi:TonB family protein